MSTRHISSANPERAASLTELAGLPGILNMLSCDEAIALTEHADDVPAEAPAVDLMPSLAIAAAGQQRRSRRSMLAVGLAGAAAVAIGAGASRRDRAAAAAARGHRRSRVRPCSRR